MFLNIYQDYFDKQDIQWDVLKKDVGTDESHISDPNWRNYPSGHVGVVEAIDIAQENIFNMNTNAGRRERRQRTFEYYVGGLWDRLILRAISSERLRTSAPRLLPMDS